MQRTSPRSTPSLTLARRIDTKLRRLARREARTRLALGRLAQLFSVRHAHHDLGFASVRDYARERLGISTSRFYEMAHVAASLSSLPSIERALLSGAISWTKTRELAGVASPDTEEAWLAFARRLTADSLHVSIARARESSDPSPDAERCVEGCSAGCEHDDDIDGEPSVTVVVRCPEPVRLLWFDTLRLSCQAAGSDLAPWQSAEIIAAEGLSESGWPDESFDSRPPRIRGRGPARRALPVPEPCSRAARVHRDHLASIAARFQSVTAEQLDRRMRSVVAAMQRIDGDLGRWLARLADGRLHRQLGYDDLGAYCGNTLGICTRKARAMLAIERARRRSCSRLARAYRSGLLSWHRCLVLLPVLNERTAALWIERAGQVMARRLADEVTWSRMACDAGLLDDPTPPRLGSALQIDPRSFVHFRGMPAAAHAGSSRNCASPRSLAYAEIRFRAPATVAWLFRSAISARRRPVEPVWLGLMRLLAHFREFWLAAPKHSDPIFERDGWRCAVPACSSRRNLHDHHIRFRSQGGGNERDNRVAVCASHHLHGIHRGVVRVWGKASSGLEWELGRTGVNGPWLRVCGRGEVYRSTTTTTATAEIGTVGEHMLLAAV
jgi:hypothetical protein